MPVICLLWSAFIGLICYTFYIIKVLVQPGLGNNGRNFGGILTTKPLIFYYVNVKLPNLDLNFLSGKGGRGWEREIERKRDSEMEIEGERADNKNDGQRCAVQLVTI
jgi:hypothetical protein